LSFPSYVGDMHREPVSLQQPDIREVNLRGRTNRFQLASRMSPCTCTPTGHPLSPSHGTLTVRPDDFRSCIYVPRKVPRRTLTLYDTEGLHPPFHHANIGVTVPTPFSTKILTLTEQDQLDLLLPVTSTHETRITLGKFSCTYRYGLSRSSTR